MSRTERELARARQDATHARAQLTGLLVELQRRLRPSALIDEVVDELRERADVLAKEGVELVKARPVATMGVVAAVLAYFFRGPLWSTIVALLSGTPATDSSAQELQPGKRRPRRDRRHGG